MMTKRMANEGVGPVRHALLTMKQNPAKVHAAYTEAALTMCGLSSWPEKTLLAYQNRSKPNKYFPIRFHVPKTTSLEEVFNPKNDWRIVVIEFLNTIPVRWASFKPSDFRASQWIPDRDMMCVSITATVIAKALTDVNGERVALIRSPTLKEWMQTRKRSQQ
jgi:hypothetical protein